LNVLKHDIPYSKDYFFKQFLMCDIAVILRETWNILLEIFTGEKTKFSFQTLTVTRTKGIFHSSGSGLHSGSPAEREQHRGKAN